MHELVVVLHQLLVDADVVAPGADGGHVGTLDGVDAIVAATGELELELVRQGRACMSSRLYDDGTQRLRSSKQECSQRAAPTQDIEVRSAGRRHRGRSPFR